jgi:hypothetical protein
VSCLVTRGKLQFLVQAVFCVFMDMRVLCIVILSLCLNMGMQTAEIVNSKFIVQGLA